MAYATLPLIRSGTRQPARQPAARPETLFSGVAACSLRQPRSLVRPSAGARPDARSEPGALGRLPTGRAASQRAQPARQYPAVECVVTAARSELGPSRSSPSPPPSRHSKGNLSTDLRVRIRQGEMSVTTRRHFYWIDTFIDSSFHMVENAPHVDRPFLFTKANSTKNISISTGTNTIGLRGRPLYLH